MSIVAKYRRGTYRVVSPDKTLKRVAPHLSACGITRCTSVTHLDTVGIHVCCSMRPKSLTLQVSNGKGLTEPAAQASAIMEALEVYHAENPLAERLRRTCVEELQAEGEDLLLPSELNEFKGEYFTDRFRCDWIKGKDLFSSRSVWAPASAVYFGCRPALHTTSNGLASGNHLTEAILHALYELLERDAVSRLSVNGKLKIMEHCSIVDTSTVDAHELRDILDKVATAGIKVVLLWLKSCAIKVPTFWALFLDRASPVTGTTLNVGWGTHIDLRVAAARAITEVAQSRLTFIHGAREDTQLKPLYRDRKVSLSSPAYRFFDEIEPTAVWSSIKELETIPVTADLEKCLDRLLVELKRAGHDRLVLFDLTQPDIGIPVVKILAPSLLFNRKLF